jgi:hypothetical protein
MFYHGRYRAPSFNDLHANIRESGMRVNVDFHPSLKNYNFDRRLLEAGLQSSVGLSRCASPAKVDRASGNQYLHRDAGGRNELQ